MRLGGRGGGGGGMRIGIGIVGGDDADGGGDAGEGGRILYDMGAEDDFDEEEDEI